MWCHLKHWLPVWVFALFLLVRTYAAEPPEPQYEGKTISYWLEGLWAAPPANAPPLLDSIRACGNIGWAGMPYLIRQPWTNSTGQLDTARPARLNAVVSLFTVADKKKVRDNIWTWIKSHDIQSRAAGIALRPSNPPYLLARKLAAARKSEDPRIQLAFAKFRQPLEAGWEPGYQMTVSPEIPRSVVDALRVARSGE